MNLEDDARRADLLGLSLEGNTAFIDILESKSGEDATHVYTIDGEGKITGKPVEQLISETGIHTGIAVVQSLHSTAAVFVNEWQNALLDDFRALLEQAVSSDAPWRHNDPRYSDCDRGNGASHLRALLLGTSAVLAVREGRVVRGAWQSIILAELDGPRTRSVSLQIFGV